MLRKGVSSIQTRKITGYAYKVAKGMMPKISGEIYYACLVAIWCVLTSFCINENLITETERAALNAGTGKNVFECEHISGDNYLTLSLDIA